MLGRYVGGTLLILGVAMLMAPSGPESSDDGAPRAESGSAEVQGATSAARAGTAAPEAPAQASRAETETVRIDLDGTSRARDALITQTTAPVTSLAESEAAAVSALAAQLDAAEASDLSPQIGSGAADAQDTASDIETTPLAPSLTDYIAAGNGEVTEATSALIAIAEGRAQAPAPEPTEPAALDADKTLFVTGSRVNVRSGPSTGFGVIGSVAYGDAVELVTFDGQGWAQVRLVGGTTGYMSRRFLARDLGDG
ncbi:MAG: SH3 domain-containing protein [Pseudomonadota bacterium]